MTYNPIQFAEKYLLALQTTQKGKPQGGLCGFELEWNLLDSSFRPLLTVGSGPSSQSFVDYFRSECLPDWLRGYSQLEVFHWMIEWATRPYYQPRGAVYEGRLMEAFLANALQNAGRSFTERLFYWHGNLLFLPSVNHDTIPGSWHLAKRRYLERCVDLYGETLATAGTHSNLSLHDSLLAWDFMHLPASERSSTQGLNIPAHLDEFKSHVYITSARLMRAFTSLFVATGASTPLKAEQSNGKPIIHLTEFDSNRNLIFPNPSALDLPDLYRSYNDYLQISYDLVQRGIRFGNNNWTPVRARSFAEPVERLIAVTSEQLQDLYARGLYSVGHDWPVDEMARQIEIQNLMSRINLPMARIEVRSDDGGQPMDIDIANLTLKLLLLLRFYADPQFARAFRYDREDISRARRNEELAARHGLRAEIENPLTGKPVGMRQFLAWTLEEIAPLAKELNFTNDLSPLKEMTSGAPNTAEKMRLRLQQEFHVKDEVSLEVIQTLAKERENQLLKDVSYIAENYHELGDDSNKLAYLLQHAWEDVRLDPQTIIHFRPQSESMVEITYPDTTSEIVDLSRQLIHIPSVTACPEERMEEVYRASSFIHDYLRHHGIPVRYFTGGKYPAILASFPDKLAAPIMLSGHFDVVQSEPDDRQFDARVEGDYLWGRGSADMKTVVATNLVWMKDTIKKGPPYPSINLLLIGNEENGETEPMGTPHVLRALYDEWKDEDGIPYSPKLFIAGERTGEKGDELIGEVCTQNRGVMRFDIIARGEKIHSGTTSIGIELTDKLLEARGDIRLLITQNLTIKSPDRWQSQLNFPFVQIGTPGIYNLTPDHAILGCEIRPIPQDGLAPIKENLENYCMTHGLELDIHLMEDGIMCDPENPYLKLLINAIEETHSTKPVIGKKLPGTSARFAPAGQGVVWGQTGIGPHTANEKHYIPSIMPYYQSLDTLSELLKESH